MRNVLDKSCRENQNTDLMFSNFFSKIVPFMKKWRKIWWGQMGHKWCHNMAHTSCMLDKQGYMHARSCDLAHARTRAQTHIQICNIYCFSMAKIIRERASMLSYTYIVLFRILHVTQHSAQSIFFVASMFTPGLKLRSVSTPFPDHTMSQFPEWRLNQVSWGCLRPYNKTGYLIARRVWSDILCSLENIINNKLK